MAKRVKKPTKDTSGDWLNTYADMVTLLLTFFVLLYASSSVDEQKWQYIYQSFQSRGRYINPVVDEYKENDTEGNYLNDQNPEYIGGEGDLPQSFDQLYAYLNRFVAQNDLSSSVSVEKSAAHIYIRFQDSVFFDGNSSVLKDEGKKMLEEIFPGIRVISNAIKRITVSGHTAYGISDVNDWDLSSARACSVVKYMEFRSVVSTEQLKVEGDAWTNPVASNDTEEGRAQNRRVEMVILRNDLDLTDPEVVKDILKHDYNIWADETDPAVDHTGDDGQKLPDGAAQEIINNIESQFSGNESTIALGEGEMVGPVIVDTSGYNVDMSDVEEAAEGEAE